LDRDLGLRKVLEHLERRDHVEALGEHLRRGVELEHLEPGLAGHVERALRGVGAHPDHIGTNGSEVAEEVPAPAAEVEDAGVRGDEPGGHDPPVEHDRDRPTALPVLVEVLELGHRRRLVEETCLAAQTLQHGHRPMMPHPCAADPTGTKV
jgi:hypothetical protein